MVVSSITMDHDRMIVHVLLPATKVDVMALSCTRSWGCVCDEPTEQNEAKCPYHAAKRQLEFLREVFGAAVDEPDFPFSPGRDGKPFSKERMVKAILEVAQLLGLSLIAPNGRAAFGGHAFRISGSRHLARCGVQVSSIMLLARWAGWVILRYLRDAPLVGLSAEYKKGRRTIIAANDGPKGKTAKPQKDMIPKKALETLANIELDIKRHDERLKELVENVKVMDARIEAQYIVSDKYSVWHKTFPWLDVGKKDFRTHCGWSYGRSVYDRRVEVPPGLPRKPTNKLQESLCPRCFPIEAPDEELDMSS